MKPIPAGTHTLPPLPYPYDALEPVIDAKTLEIHHDKHHKKYVEDLNQTELALVKAGEQTDWHMIPFLEEQLAFNGSGHILHSVYWTNMTRPGTGGEPGKHTLSYLDWYFGSRATFMAQFAATAGKVQGSGWAILGYNTAFCRLELLQCEKHQNCILQGTVPILVCDVWEHAYYLKYQNDRAGYISRWWDLVNWADVEARFLHATRGKLPLEALAV
ncbi:MAG: superoxide dismutase [Oscillospiraceae bacterium]|nr:superoxide dismutase [Oscillospiraceae bacterium]